MVDDEATRAAVTAAADDARPRPLRVVLISHDGDLFGAQHALLRLAVGLARRPDFQPLVAVPFEGRLSSRCRDYGLEVIVSGYRQCCAGKSDPWSACRRALHNQRARRSLGRRLRHFAPDLIFSNTATIAVGALLARRLRVAHVWHLHDFNGPGSQRHYDWGWPHTRRLLRARSNRLVCNSEAVRRHHVRVLGRDDIATVYNGFDFSPLPDGLDAGKYARCVADTPVTELLLLGELVEGKGQHDAILAVADLVQAGRRVRLCLAGSGDAAYRARLQALITEHRLEACVSFLDYVQDPQRLYAQAAITLVCSRREGFGRTAVESLAQGTPVVGTDAGGLPEIVQAGRSGLLYPQGDWRALSGRIQALLDSRTLYGEISATGAAMVRQTFPARRNVRELAEMFTREACAVRPELARKLAPQVVSLPRTQTRPSARLQRAGLNPAETPVR